MEERIALFQDYATGLFSVTGVCERYGISRQTFYVLKRRRESGHERWFEDGSHAAKTCPHTTDEALATRIVALRRQHAHYGPKKIKAVLEARSRQANEDVAWPATSTIGDILKREGLVESKRRKRPAVAQGELVAAATQPNEEWGIDFKGWYRTASGLRCDPLTVTDSASRYLLVALIVAPTTDGVKIALWSLFDDVGLPFAMRSDNGAPFGSSGAGGLSALSVWLLKLGVEPRYIPPASPQHNGRHERMHRTMKAATGASPAANRDDLQGRFDTFRIHYNEERPHEALGQTTPASHWQPSRRPMPAFAPEPWYDAGHEVRRVRMDGTLKWKGEYVFIGEALAGEPVGLSEQETGHLVRFCGRDLGLIGVDGRFLRFAPPRARLRAAPEPAVDTGT